MAKSVPWEIDDTAPAQSKQSSVPWEIDDTAPAQSQQSKPPADSALSRFGTGLADPLYGLAQIADKAIVNPIRQFVSPGATSMDDVIHQREADYKAPEGFDVARLGGNVLNPVNFVPGAAVGNVGRAAAAGAAQSVLAPSTAATTGDYLKEKTIQAGIGAATGGVLSKTLKGVTPSAEAQTLMEHGIQPTVGQSVAGKGPVGNFINSWEQKLTSVPAVGEAINFARRRALTEFEQAALQRATGGAAVKSLDEANDFATKLYADVVPHLVPTREAVIGAQEAVRNAAKNPEMSADALKILNGIMEKNFANFGKLSGDGLKKLDSELGFLGRKYAKGSPADQTLSDEIYNLQHGLRSGLEYGLPENLQGALMQANSVWRNLIPLNKASSARADERILPRALQKQQASLNRQDVSRMDDEMLRAAVRVLPSNVPDSGTAGRVMLGGLASGQVGMLPLAIPAAAGAAVGATRPVQRAIMGNTAWQKGLQGSDAALSSMLAAALRGKGQSNE